MNDEQQIKRAHQQLDNARIPRDSDRARPLHLWGRIERLRQRELDNKTDMGHVAHWHNCALTMRDFANTAQDLAVEGKWLDVKTALELSIEAFEAADRGSNPGNCPVCAGGQFLELRVQMDQKLYVSCPICCGDFETLYRSIKSLAIDAFHAGYERATCEHTIASDNED